MKYKKIVCNGDKREEFLTSVFRLLFIMVIIPIFCFSLLFSWKNTDLWNEFVYKFTDNILLNITGMVIGIGVICLISKFAEKYLNQKKVDNIAVIVSIICMVISIMWVYMSKTCPQGDQGNLVSYAIDYENGDTSSLLKGEYVSNHRQQLGNITFLRVLFKIFSNYDFKLYQYFTALTVFILVFCGYQFVKLITMDNIKAQLVYLFSMLLCVPMYGYVPFVYGDLNSTAFVMFAAWLLLSSLKRFSWKKLVLLLICSGIMLQLRRNTVIVMIAFGIILVVKEINKHNKNIIYLGLAILSGAILSQLAIYMPYMKFLPKDAEETPALLFVVMGIHDDIEDMPGWYDGANETIYQSTGYDAAKAKEVAWKEIETFVNKCMNSPGYALGFFTQKTNTQWNVPMYQCLVANNSFYDEPVKFADDIYFNGNDKYLEAFMNIYQLMIYGGVLAVVVLMKNKWTQIENYVLLIAVYGGFLFSLIWEAKARYVFPYFLMMIPYAAIGITELLDIKKRNVVPQKLQ